MLFNLRRKKRGQVSGFLIVAIIILIMIFAYFFVKKLLVYDVQPFPVVNPSFKDVHELVQSCLTKNTEDAIKLLAMQGGYINLPKRLLLNKEAYLNLDGTEYSLIKIPYWYWRGYNMVPSISDMEKQIAEYVEENLPQCVDNFDSLNSTYEIYSLKPKAYPKIYDDNVEVTLKFPISAKKLDTNERAELDTFKVVLNARLKKLYDLAKLIHFDEAKNYFLENLTIDLMVINPKIPFDGIELSCSRKEWNIPSLINELKQTLYANIPRVKVDKTNFVPFKDSEVYEQNNMFWHVTDLDDYKDISVGLNYNPSWRLGFRVRPRDGDIIYSSEGRIFNQKFFPKTCIQTYHFTYDVSYPVRFILTDKDSFNGEGLTFTFAEPVIVDHNQPEREQYGINDFFIPIYKESFCEKKVDSPFSVKAYDKVTGFDLSDVNVSLNCLVRYCPMGKTKYNSYDDGYDLTIYHPQGCSGGYLELSKDGYLDAEQFVDFTKQTDASVAMIPVADIPYKVFTRTKGKNEGLRKTLPSNYKVFVHIHNKYDDFLELYNRTSSKIRLILANTGYNLTINLLDGDKFVGGYKGYWNYTYGDVVDAQAVEFYAADFAKEIKEQNITHLDKKLYNPIFNYDIVQNANNPLDNFGDK